MDIRRLSPDMIIAHVFEKWPETIPVFFRHRMLCVGCPMSRFMTLKEAIHIYQLPGEAFLDDLEREIQKVAQSSQRNVAREVKKQWRIG